MLAQKPHKASNRLLLPAGEPFKNDKRCILKILLTKYVYLCII